MSVLCSVHTIDNLMQNSAAPRGDALPFASKVAAMFINEISSMTCAGVIFAQDHLNLFILTNINKLGFIVTI